MATASEELRSTAFERLYKDGLPPENGGYPGFNPSRTVEDGMIIEKDVAVPMRDGVNIYVDLFRPDTETKVPVLVAWSAYGKHSPQRLEHFPADTGVDTAKLSKHVAFEAPDPVYWCPNGYAVIYVDPRGTWGSEGVAESFWGKEEGQDYHDLIEWAGTQEWSNGKVGMAGVSYLAIIQWLTAATQPPHLAAINPWEGVSDLYREFSFHGGIPETQFLPWWHEGVLLSKTKVEDSVGMRDAHLLWDEYWETKRADFSKITVPAYVVASWSDQGLHTRGTLEAFKALGSKEKWLDIHGRKKWGYFYDERNVEKQRAFFDKFLKGEDTEVSEWPPVQLEIRDRYYEGEIRAEQEWPIARTNYTPLYLDASTGSMVPTAPAGEATCSYNSEGAATRIPFEESSDRAVFEHTFGEDTEIVGHAKLHLWVEADGSDDLDLFVALQKVDAEGNIVTFPFFSIWENGPVALGWLRASHRELDTERSTPQQPWLTHRKEQRLAPGERVPVDIEIWPSGTLFHAGETLRLIVQGTDFNVYPAGTPTQRHHSDRNKGNHIIHTGGQYDSHLLVPVIPPKSS